MLPYNGISLQNNKKNIAPAIITNRYFLPEDGCFVVSPLQKYLKKVMCRFTEI